MTRYGSGVRLASSLLVAGAVCTVAGSASANGRFPASNRIVFAPTDTSVVAVRATYGVILSHDDGTTWSFLCEDAIGLPPTAIQDPPLAISGGPALIAGTAVPVGGLDVSSDLGCNWSCAGGALAGQTIVDITVRPDAVHSVVALASSFVFTAADAGGDGSGPTPPQSLSQVFQSTDDGVTWATFGTPLDPSVLPTTIEVASGDPARLYVSATRGFGDARTASLFVSNDSGATWIERPVPLDPTRNETSVYIGAVDPADEDRVYLRTDRTVAAPRDRRRGSIVPDDTRAHREYARVRALARRREGLRGQHRGRALLGARTSTTLSLQAMIRRPVPRHARRRSVGVLRRCRAASSPASRPTTA